MDARSSRRLARLTLVALACGPLACAPHPGDSYDSGAAADTGIPDGGDLPDADSGPPPRVPLNHRPMTLACPQTRGSTVPDGGFDATNGYCHTDAECMNPDAGANGRCAIFPAYNFPACSYDQCVIDSDCGDSGICSCRDPYGAGENLCVPSNCSVDSDCGNGGFCSPTMEGCGAYVGTVGYYCHTAEDHCLDDSDCDADAGFPHCVFDSPINRWICAPLDCTG